MKLRINFEVQQELDVDIALLGGSVAETLPWSRVELVSDSVAGGHLPLAAAQPPVASTQSPRFDPKGGAFFQPLTHSIAPRTVGASASTGVLKRKIEIGENLGDPPPGPVRIGHGEALKALLLRFKPDWETLVFTAFEAK